MNNGKLKITFIGALLLTIFSWYWCSVTLFSHEHFVEGERIMHSHPLAGTSHSHTSSQIQVISFLSMFTALAAVVGVALCRYEGFLSERAIELTERVASVDSCVASLRAPPVSRM